MQKVTSKAKVTAKVTKATAAPVAPQHNVDHGALWRTVCKAKLPGTATLAYQPGNPWRGAGGTHFYNSVLAKKPATVQAALDLATKAKIEAGAARNHLYYFLTWPTATGGKQATVGGLSLCSSAQATATNLAKLWAVPAKAKAPAKAKVAPAPAPAPAPVAPVAPTGTQA